MDNRHRADSVPVVVGATEADSYSAAIPGVQLDVTRTGLGSGPNVVASWNGPGLSLASARVGFPVIGRTEIADDTVAVVHVTTAPSGTHWCGNDLEPGAVLVYGPGAVHTAVSPIGVEYSLAVASLPDLQQIAEDLGRSVSVIDRGNINSDPSRADVSGLSPLSAAVAEAGPDPKLGEHARDEAAQAVLAMLGGPESLNRGDDRGLNSHRIVNDCLDRFRPEDGAPSIRSMCLTANVSERRLRNAFVDAFDMPPAAYWRLHQLSEARERLVHADPRGATVQAIALDLGFCHLGRFAARYQHQFGERPSATLAARASGSASRVVPNVAGRSSSALVA